MKTTYIFLSLLILTSMKLVAHENYSAEGQWASQSFLNQPLPGYEESSPYERAHSNLKIGEDYMTFGGFDPNEDETTPTPGGEVPLNSGEILLYLVAIYAVVVTLRRRRGSYTT